MRSTDTPVWVLPPIEWPNLDFFSIVAIVQNVVVANNARMFSAMDSYEVKTTTSRLLSQIRWTINEVARTSGLTMPIDWESRVFEPIIALFDVPADLGTSPEDAEYALLVVTMIALAYELLLLPETNNLQPTYDFLTTGLGDYLCEPGVSSQISEFLDAERVRLTRSVADIKVIRAIQTLRTLLPDESVCGLKWKTSLPMDRSSKDGKISYVKSLGRRRPSSANTAVSSTLCRTPSPAPSDFSSISPKPGEDVHVIVSLISGSHATFGFVKSLEDRAGLSVKFGRDVYNDFKRPHETANDLTATVTIAPGCIYDIEDVLRIDGGTHRDGWTLIETKTGEMHVGNGSYHRYLIEWQNWDGKVVIKNSRQD
jgi:hypothetical protein